MEARGRSRDGAVLGREHRLVVGAIAVLRRAARRDVGRQGRRAQPLDRLVERGAGELEAQLDLAGVGLLFNLGVERRKQTGHAFAGLAEADALPDLELLRWADQARASGSRRRA